MVPVAIGVDFGTTNSVVAVLNDDASVNVLRHGPGLGDVFRTVLCFWAEEVRGRQLLHEAACARASALGASSIHPWS